MKLTEEKSRDNYTDAASFAMSAFGGRLGGGYTDAEYLDARRSRVFAVGGLPMRVPVALALMNDTRIAPLFENDSESHLIMFGSSITHTAGDGAVLPLGETAENAVRETVGEYLRAAGELGSDGEHIIDLKTPEVSTHYRINLLIGNRIGCENPLITTPKGAVDALGGGSFRAHADEQVTATRAVLQQEENGDPSNRQFYLVENDRQIFFSANVWENVKSAFCTHRQNHTVIEYETECGLRITRTIFVLPQYDSLPQATEVQHITVENMSGRERSLKIVATGMFGVYPNNALANDIVYCHICHESGVMKDGERVMAIAPNYWPRYHRFSKHFAVLLSGGEGMDSYSVSYTDFFGTGDVRHPQNVAYLPSHPQRKKAPFFAMGKSFTLAPGAIREFDTFVGMVTEKEDCHEAFEAKLSALITRFSAPGEVLRSLGDVTSFYDRYSSYLRLDTGDAQRDAYINRNLPFQVFYQSFVSRSFAWTQKAFRQIGFREIQDMYASLYYMAAMGNAPLARDMISRWAENVYEMGYANHNFYYEGKEPGQCSDDALWLVQAVYRYIMLTGDTGFLDAQYRIAGSDKTRSLYDTMKALIVYSGKISVGDHGMPILDAADWNDCLKLDLDWINGPEKERRYRAQLEETGESWGARFRSHFCESVMNAFLLKIAEDELAELAHLTGRESECAELRQMSRELYDNIQKHAWKGNFFARAMINSEREGGYTYVGASGDRLSADPDIEGSYFLNSFTWSILSDTASEEQIAVMLGVVNKHLRCEAGLKLSTPCDLDKISSQTATEHYFPGDRENGAVFKHATMMCTSALFKASRSVSDATLAAELASLGHWMLDRVYPFKAIADPFLYCGNPRFCTQYNNSETLENVGPMLSGTASWLSLTVSEFLGISYSGDKMTVSPILPFDAEKSSFELNRGGTKYSVTVEKKKGFARPSASTEYYLDGERCSAVFDAPSDKGHHTLRIVL